MGDPNNPLKNVIDIINAEPVKNVLAPHHKGSW